MEKLTELKAKAYDMLAIIEQAQRELKKTNQEIAEIIEGKKDEKA